MSIAPGGDAVGSTSPAGMVMTVLLFLLVPMIAVAIVKWQRSGLGGRTKSRRWLKGLRKPKD